MAGWTNLTPSAAALAAGNAYLYESSGALKYQGTSGSAVTLANADGTQPTVLDEVIPTDPTGAYFDGTGLKLYGTANNSASTPDANALDVTGDIDLIAKVTLSDWTPAATTYFISKYGTGTPQRSYRFYLSTGGYLNIQWTTDGSTGPLSAGSTVVTGITDGSTKWIRCTIDVDNGAAGRDIAFYTSDDGSSWTQLGTTVTQAGTTSIYAGTAALDFGASDGANANFIGTFHRAIVKNGIGGTTVFDADFSAVPADSFAFTESSSNAATVTLTTTRYSFGLPGANLYNTGTTTPAGNSTTYLPFYVTGKSVTVKHAAFECTSVPASTSTVRIAIYAADSQGQPTGAPLWNSGAVSVSTSAAAIYRVRATPFTLATGNYVIAINQSVSFTYRQYIGARSFIPNTLGANPFARYSVTETLSGDFANPGTKWNTRNNASGAGQYNLVLLGWS